MPGLQINEGTRVNFGPWGLWPVGALRGSGFPVAGTETGATGEFSSTGPCTDEEQYQADVSARTQIALAYAKDPLFRNAIEWQNPNIVWQAVDTLVTAAPTSLQRSKNRQRQEVVRRYAHRFAVKNDSIGFFGPVGWCAIDPDSAPATTWVCGKKNAGRPDVDDWGAFYADWVVDALARRISADKELREIWPPRVNGLLVVEVGKAHLPGMAERELSPSERKVLQAIDGKRSPEDIAACCGLEHAEVISVLEHLKRIGYVHWSLLVSDAWEQDVQLRVQLERLPDSLARARWLETVNQLTALRRELSSLPLDSQDLSAVLNKITAQLEELGLAGTRTKGSGGSTNRSAVYLEARRATEAVLGSEFIDALACIAPLLTIGRWVCEEYAERMHAAWLGEFRKAECSTLALSDLWMRCMPIPHETSKAVLDEVMDTAAETWQEIAASASTPEAAEVVLDLAKTQEAVNERFPLGRLAWGDAEYLSPDLMLWAGVDGLPMLVLGELHLAMNPLRQGLFCDRSPYAEVLDRQTAIDRPDGIVRNCVPKSIPPKVSIRNRDGLVGEQDIRIEYFHPSADLDALEVIRSGECRVIERDGQLRVIIPGVHGERHLLETFGPMMTPEVLNQFSLNGSFPKHVRRTSIGRLVVQRETWHVPVAEFTSVSEKSPFARYQGVQAVRELMKWPRFVFFVIKTEPRPLYIDLDSTASAEILCKSLRRQAEADKGASVTVSEMLPDPDQAILPDPDGAMYSSEFRLVFHRDGAL